jgi:hypothetical protein
MLAVVGVLVELRVFHLLAALVVLVVEETALPLLLAIVVDLEL